MRTILRVIFLGVCALTIPLSAEEVRALDGLFGAQFGKVMPKEARCVTNNVGELAYEYLPKKVFRGFTSYILFATPCTRQVSQVRAVMTESDGGAAKEEMVILKKIFEKKYGREMTEEEETLQLVFPNAQIHISHQDGAIFIDAISQRLAALTQVEVGVSELVAYRKDVGVLHLTPPILKGATRMLRIDSVFGIGFGKPYIKKGTEQNDSGAWVHQFIPRGKFLDFQNFLCFGTHQGNLIYFVRAAYEGEGGLRCRDHAKRVLERVTGRTFIENGGDDDNLSMQFGNAMITLERHKNDSTELVLLDFLDLKLYQEEINAAEKRQEASLEEDMDAL